MDPNNQDRLPPKAFRKKIILKGSQHYPVAEEKISSAETTENDRANAQARFRDWQGLPEQRRALIRQRWERFQSLDPETQARVRQNFRAFARMPPERRAQLRQQWQRADVEERRRMLQELRRQRREQQRGNR